MMGPRETLAFDPQAFDDEFFASYRQEIVAISTEEQASHALASVLTLEKADGTQKSFAEVRDESRAFFANEWVQHDEAIMNHMAMQFAQACMTHLHGAELLQDGQLSSLFENGISHMANDTHDHKRNDSDDQEYEIDPKTGRKVKKKPVGWLRMIFEERN